MEEEEQIQTVDQVDQMSTHFQLFLREMLQMDLTQAFSSLALQEVS